MKKQIIKGMAALLGIASLILVSDIPVSYIQENNTYRNYDIKFEYDAYHQRVYPRYIFKDGQYSIFYNIGGKYSTFTFEAYSQEDCDIGIYSGDGAMIDRVEIRGSEFSDIYTVCVAEIYQLEIRIGEVAEGGYVYILDAIVE